MVYTLFLKMGFFIAPDLVGYYTISIGLYAVSPFAVYLDIILVFFNVIYSSKISYFYYRNQTCFRLVLSITPQLDVM